MIQQELSEALCLDGAVSNSQVSSSKRPVDDEGVAVVVVPRGLGGWAGNDVSGGNTTGAERAVFFF